ncbi:2-dehydropantoate 2-reductase [Alteribacter aurantiacus]|uniref:2-dehydropantoate 2-reductase n=1 Tax=Alteribacter aurantiacus TaxID=254410 RepID=UPI000419303E|nr:2-dehydropantoate 2-reductase [Alteribacter aurantiacus]
MKIAVIGGGSVGMLIASYCAIGKLDTTVYTKSKDQANRINEKGITLHKSNQNMVIKEKLQAKSIEEWGHPAYKIIVIAVKQTQLDDVLQVLKKSGLSGSSIIFAMNGMGHMEKANRDLSACSLYPSVITHGAMRSNTGVEVKHTGVGMWVIGPWTSFQKKPERFIEKMVKGGFLTTYEENIQTLQMEKLVVNGVINPLTAMYNVKNGALLEIDEYYHNAQLVFDEIKSVIDIPVYWEVVEQVLLNTYENHSSMLQDIKNERKTEAESITGYLLTLGEKKELPMPLVAFLHQSIKGMERRWRECLET